MFSCLVYQMANTFGQPSGFTYKPIIMAITWITFMQVPVVYTCSLQADAVLFTLCSCSQMRGLQVVLVGQHLSVCKVPVSVESAKSLMCQISLSLQKMRYMG